MTRYPKGLKATVLAAILATMACNSSGSPAEVTSPDPVDAAIGGFLSCSIPQQMILTTGKPRDGIPALTDPTLVPAGASGASYLLDDDRVVGIEVEGTYVAIPHNILWWHEIVNFNSFRTPLAVTYSPATGSSLVFDRADVSGAEFGVSGLIFNNNLIMYERVPDESLWPQMMRRARCGPHNGTRLTVYPATEMRWGTWRVYHPTTLVVSEETGHARDYRRNPYEGYDVPSNSTTLYPQGPLDDRRPPKERVFGIPPVVYDEDVIGGSVAFPFGALDNGEPLRVIHQRARGRPAVIFWDSEAQGAVAYRPTYGGSNLNFEVRGEEIVDIETESVWDFEGRAVLGELEGERLELLPEAYVSFWFAWVAFAPSTKLWEG